MTRRFVAICIVLAASSWLVWTFAHGQGQPPELLPAPSRAPAQTPAPSAARAPAPAAQTSPARQESELAALVDRLDAAVPTRAAGLTDQSVAAVRQAAEALDERVALLALYPGLEPEQLRPIIRQAELMVAVKTRVDAILTATLERRRELAALPAGPSRRAAISNYLQIATQMIDLSGRLRYTLFDGLYDAAVAVAPQPAMRDQLVEMLIRYKSSIGADVMADALFDPPPDSPNGAKPASPASKRRLLRLIAVTGNSDMTPLLAEFLGAPQTPGPLVLEAAETILQIGLPQAPRPGQDPQLGEPAVTPRSLLALVEKIDPRGLSAAQRTQRDRLVARLHPIAQKGLAQDVYLWAGQEVRPGDWLLMRNPSPYNLFTDLSPGLFTHVGVVTSETGSDGVRRMVLVDLPERGTVMQTTNFDTFLQRTLHYVVLRHEDPKVGEKMGRVAREVIGAPTRFDLNFRTDRVAALQGKPLAGQLIHTYCAGLLLLCAQETGKPRTDFFPIPEGPAGGKTVANLETLDLSFGKDFISPTGALYAPGLKIVARRLPMYEPSREIEQAIYDHFCSRLSERDLKPTNDLFQSLRVRVAEAARTNPLLAQAMAAAAGVNAEMDLVAAAKAQAVVETLDDIALDASRSFFQAREAVLAAPEAELARDGLSEQQIASIRELRTTHANLVRRLDGDDLTPRQLRVELVRYYVEQGRRRLDERFYGGQ